MKYCDIIKIGDLTILKGVKDFKIPTCRFTHVRNKNVEPKSRSKNLKLLINTQITERELMRMKKCYVPLDKIDDNRSKSSVDNPISLTRTLNTLLNNNEENKIMEVENLLEAKKEALDDESQISSPEINNNSSNFNEIKIRSFARLHNEEDNNNQKQLTANMKMDKFNNSSAIFKENLQKENVNLHRKKKKLNCNVCKIEFTSIELFEKHIECHSLFDLVEYKCNGCNKLFNSASLIKQHRPCWSFREKKIHCENCDYKTNKLSILKAHSRIHTGERPFSCNYCRKTFGHANSLTRHLRTHTGERPYKCKLCNATYTEISHVKQHYFTHTGERPHHCEICNKTYYRRDHLKRHLRLKHSYL